MANKNLPPGWGNRNSSAKPDWGNQKKEQPKQESQYISASNDNEKIENPIKPKEIIQEAPKAEISEQTISISNEEKTEQVIAETEASENVSISKQTLKAVSVDEESEKELTPKKSNAAVIILVILLVVAVIALGVFAVLYFTKDKPQGDNDSVSDNVSAVVTETSTTDISTTTTEATTTATETTTTQTTTSTTESTTTTITTTTATLLNENDYIGFWHMENCAESELTIHSIDSSTVTFSLWYYRLWSIENLTAIVEQNSAYFYDDNIEGILTFDDDSIRLYVTMSNISGIPSQYEEVYSMRIDESVQYGNGMKYFENVSSFEPYIIDVTNPKLLIYDSPSYYANIVGVITDKSKYTIVEEYTEQYETWGKLKSGVGWINLYDATMINDSHFNNEEIPDVRCPNCDYGLYTNDENTDIFSCPYCEYTWLP
ncbi:MAG: hypothetical protein IJ010_06605 [Ruminococcus sp.]|nr:hypothetical protein [Ruminococcus sp.]